MEFKIDSMEAFIVLLILAILALPIILLIWVKSSINGSIGEVLNKLNALIVKVNKLEFQEDKKAVVVDEDPIVINEVY